MTSVRAPSFEIQATPIGGGVQAEARFVGGIEHSVDRGRRPGDLRFNFALEARQGGFGLGSNAVEVREVRVFELNSGHPTLRARLKGTQLSDGRRDGDGFSGRFELRSFNTIAYARNPASKSVELRFEVSARVLGKEKTFSFSETVQFPR